MGAVAVDTHAIVWYVTSDSRLSATATATLDGATADREPLCLLGRAHVSRRKAGPFDGSNTAAGCPR